MKKIIYIKWTVIYECENNITKYLSTPKETLPLVLAITKNKTKNINKLE